jgi:deoxyribodipyrimidine photo-lyase
MRGLVWLRSDLRLDDNPSFESAFLECEEVMAVYFYSSEQWKNHHESNVKLDFLIQNLKSFSKDLSKLNVPLMIVNSANFNSISMELDKFLSDQGIDKIYWNREFGLNEERRDDEVRASLKAASYPFYSFNDQILFEPGSLKTQQGGDFSVFTPFKNKWKKEFHNELLPKNFYYRKKNKLNLESNVFTFNFRFKKTHSCDMSLWPIGEGNALVRLEEFLSQQATNYERDRNDPDLEGTSRLSPYLALGLISSRRCIQKGYEKNERNFIEKDQGIVKWLDELIWREFYRNIMHLNPNVSRNQPFKDSTKNIVWKYDEHQYKAWCEGQTGFPIIDAAMRQLKYEGWMHNRLRMVVAMFFTKNMFHDWRLGERFFMENLIDGDFSSNNGGWQWSASTGTDASPYFRIFNPISQSEKFDKDGAFIRKYVPELRDLDSREIHFPFGGLLFPEGYFKPMLDLKESRLFAIETFKSHKDN